MNVQVSKILHASMGIMKEINKNDCIKIYMYGWGGGGGGGGGSKALYHCYFGGEAVVVV